MGLTISTHPTEVITNAPEFTVTTSLTEGASYQNLRVRATVYMGGESAPVAVLEQPKGLNDWNLFALLNNLCGKCNHEVGGSTSYIQPTEGSELLTGWTNYYSGYSTFTTSGREVSVAVSSGSAKALSNSLGAVTPGDIFVVSLEYGSFNDIGSNSVYLGLDSGGTDQEAETKYAGLTAGGDLNSNHIFFLMTHATAGSHNIRLSVDGASNYFSLEAMVRKISDFKNNPGVYFHVKFEEVYENASNVTTTGAESWSDTLLFIPAIVRPGESFDDYLIDGSGKKFLSRIEDGGIFYKYGIGMELRPMFVSVSPYLQVLIAAGTTSQYGRANVGWGMASIKDSNSNIDATDESITVTVVSTTSTTGSTIYTGAIASIDCEMRCFPDIKALSFVGDLGEEVVLFKGLMTWTGEAEKTFTKNERRIRKVLRAFKKFNMILRTVYETEEVRRLLHELIYTELPVWLYKDDAADNYTEVTVITDELPITDEDELLESEIEIEYYE